MINVLRSTGFAWLPAAIGICVLTGCGSRGPETIRVTGSVTLDGQPVEGAMVAFFPEGDGRPARGVTDASGKFTLMTFVAGDGALPGNHRVSVFKHDVLATPSVQVGDESIDTPRDGGMAEDVRHLLPVRYASPSTSPLTAEVKRRMAPVVLELTSN